MWWYKWELDSRLSQNIVKSCFILRVGDCWPSEMFWCKTREMRTGRIHGSTHENWIPECRSKDRSDKIEHKMDSTIQLFQTNSHHTFPSPHLRTRWSSTQDQHVPTTYTQPSLLIRLRCTLNLSRIDEWRTMHQSRRSQRRCDSFHRYKSAGFCIAATLLQRNGPTHGTPNAILTKGEEKKSKLLSFSNSVPIRETAINTVSGVWRAGSGKMLSHDDRSRRLHD